MNFNIMIMLYPFNKDKDSNTWTPPPPRGKRDGVIGHISKGESGIWMAKNYVIA